MDPEEYKHAVMRQVLSTINAELDHPPQVSAAVRFALQKGPPDWKAAMLKTDNALALANYFKPYAEAALVESIKTKLAGNEAKQNWLMLQAGTLRAYLQRQVGMKPAPLPASAPVPAPVANQEGAVAEVDEENLGTEVEPIPAEDGVTVDEGGAL